MMMRAATWTTTTSKNNTTTASLLLSSALRRKMLSSSSSSSSFALNHRFRGKKSAVNVTTPRRGGGGGGRFGGGLRTNASNKNTSAGECELVECEVDFATKDDDDEKEDAFGASLTTTIKACVANINGNTIDASALRNVTVMNTDGNLETPIPLTGDKDVVVYLRHLG